MNPAGPPSPCTNDCVFDQSAGQCIGCRRTMDEIMEWSSFDDETKWRILGRLGVNQTREHT